MSQDSSPLDVAVVRVASTVTVTVAGELDIATAEFLVDRIDAVIADGDPDDLILDLAPLRFCDSAGINALVRLRKMADHHGYRFGLVNSQSAVRRVLELAGLGTYLNIDRGPGA